MAQQKGTLHILRNFRDEIDNSGVYDVAFTFDDGDAEPEKVERIRRFYGEQELTEFLKKHLNCSAKQVNDVMAELEKDGRSRITGLDLDDDDLRDLKLAA